MKALLSTAIAVLLASCGGGDDDTTTHTEATHTERVTEVAAAPASPVIEVVVIPPAPVVATPAPVIEAPAPEHPGCKHHGNDRSKHC